MWPEINQDWWLPRHCLLCLAPARGLDLCDGCRADLPRIPRACAICAVPLPSGERCARCLARPPPFAAAVAPYAFAPPLSTLIHGLKFSGSLSAAAVLGELLAEHLEACGAPRVQGIVPVPLHPSRQRSRGFNQSLEIARPVSARLGIPLMPRLATRRRATAAQSGVESAAGRRENVRGAFSAKPVLAGCTGVAILDDVVTTGATAASLAAALGAAGFRRVELWSVARASPAWQA